MTAEKTRPAEVISFFVSAVLSFLIAFGASLSDEQVIAVLGLVGATPGVVTLVVQTLRAVRDNKE